VKSEAMTRITQTTSFLSDILADVRRGRLAPAAFQRPYRWTARDVEELWQSIDEECPVGTFLVWRPKPDVDVAALARQRLGPLIVDPAGRPGLILDGQNRLATYAWSLLGPTDPRPDPGRDDISPEEASVWYGDRVLRADIRQRKVAFIARSDDGPDHLYAPGIVGDIRMMNQTVRARMMAGADIDEPGLDWLDQLGQRLRQTRTIVTTLDGATPAQAFRLFQRIARAGVAVSDDDLARSLGLARPLTDAATEHTEDLP
jgi:hypothetical protein